MWDEREAQERGGSCGLSFVNETKPLSTTEGKVVPDELLQKMKDYAKELRRKHPHMKIKRVERKVAEYFKIKLV